MRTVVMIILFAFTSQLIAQDDLVLRSFVKRDTIQLRWSPTNYDDFTKGLKNGYQLKRTDEAGDVKLYEVLPLEERLSSMPSDNRSLEIIEILKAIANSEAPDGTPKETVFAMLLLSAGPDQTLARQCGVYFEDTEFDANKTYRYSVVVKDTDLGSEDISVNTRKKDHNGSMSVLKGHGPKKRTAVYLEWEAKDIEKDYAGFWIEKSMDGKSFERLNKLPHIFFRSQDEKEKTKADYLDSLVEEGRSYFYRIQGINHFGDIGKRSAIVEVYVPRFLKGECRIDTVFADKNNRSVQGRFLFNNDSDIGNLKEFVLYRSDSMFFGFEEKARMLPARNNFKFNYESDLFSGDKNYFKVAAISQDGDTSYSYPYYFFTLDQEPPSAPIELTGEINDSGIVHLFWKRNPELDIRGYRVFMANALHEEFMEVTKVYELDTIYNDTLPLNNLTSEVYFKVAAVDMNYNNSTMSEIIKLEKPDTIAPAPCVFKSYKPAKGGVYLRWANSPSSDVIKNKLCRISSTGESVSLLNWLSDSLSEWTDSVNIDPGTVTYQILTYDERDNESKSETLSVQYEPGFRKGIDSLEVVVDRESRKISLLWSPLSVEEIYSVQVYRSKNDDSFILLKTLRSEFESGYQDDDLSINNRYSYKVKLLYKSGISSKLSRAVEVTY